MQTIKVELHQIVEVDGVKVVLKHEIETMTITFAISEAVQLWELTGNDVECTFRVGQKVFNFSVK